MVTSPSRLCIVFLARILLLCTIHKLIPRPSAYWALRTIAHPYARCIPPLSSPCLVPQTIFSLFPTVSLSTSASPPQENIEKKSFCPVNAGPKMASTSASSMTAPLPEHRALDFSWAQRSSMPSSPEVTFSDFCTRSLKFLYKSVMYQNGKVG